MIIRKISVNFLFLKPLQPLPKQKITLCIDDDNI